MATIYCRSDGDNTTGATWATAKTTIDAAITAAGDNGIVYVGDGHTETSSGTITYGAPLGGSDVTCLILAVDDTGDPEPPTTLVDKDSGTHPVITLTNGDDINFNGSGYYYGIEWTKTAGSLTDIVKFSPFADTANTFEKCLFDWSLNDNGSSIVDFQSGSSGGNYERTAEFIDCDFKFGGPSRCFEVGGGGNLIIRGGALLSVGVSVDVFRIDAVGDQQCRIEVSDFDMSGLTADDYILRADSSNAFYFTGTRLKVPASYSGEIASEVEWLRSSPDNPVKIHSYGSADQYYQFFEASRMGTIECDTAVYRNSGATYDGTNGFSAKMITNSEALEKLSPLRFKLSEMKLDLTSATTLTVHTVIDSATALNNDDFWIEVEYPDSTDLALGVLDKTTRVGLLATPASLTTSTETWTGTSGFTNEAKDQVAVTISSITGATDAQVTVWACLAKPTTTVRVCPKVEVS